MSKIVVAFPDRTSKVGTVVSVSLVKGKIILYTERNSVPIRNYCSECLHPYYDVQSRTSDIRVGNVAVERCDHAQRNNTVCYILLERN